MNRLFRILLLTILLFVTVLVNGPYQVPTANASNKHAGPQSGYLAFVSNRGGDNEIYLAYVQDDGVTDLDNLTNNPASDILPTWSYDGRFIAFASNRNTGSEQAYDLFIMNADGSNVILAVSVNDMIIAITWSPSGGNILYETVHQENNRLHYGIGVYHPPYYYDKGFLPSGIQTISYPVGRGSQQVEYIIQAQDIGFTFGGWYAHSIALEAHRSYPGQEVREESCAPIILNVTTGSTEFWGPWPSGRPGYLDCISDANLTAPVWSPDEAWVAVVYNRTDAQGLYYGGVYKIPNYNIGATDLTPILLTPVETIGRHNTLGFDNLTWSDDGRYIYTISNLDESTYPNRQLYRIDANTKEIQRLTDYPSSLYGSTVSPDGNWLAFNIWPPSDSVNETHVLNLNNSIELNLSPGRGVDRDLAWLPGQARFQQPTDTPTPAIPPTQTPTVTPAVPWVCEDTGYRLIYEWVYIAHSNDPQNFYVQVQDIDNPLLAVCVWDTIRISNDGEPVVLVIRDKLYFLILPGSEFRVGPQNRFILNYGTIFGVAGPIYTPHAAISLGSSADIEVNGTYGYTKIRLFEGHLNTEVYSTGQSYSLTDGEYISFNDTANPPVIGTFDVDEALKDWQSLMDQSNLPDLPPGIELPPILTRRSGLNIEPLLLYAIPCLVLGVAVVLIILGIRKLRELKAS